MWLWAVTADGTRLVATQCSRHLAGTFRSLPRGWKRFSGSAGAIMRVSVHGPHAVVHIGILILFVMKACYYLGADLMIFKFFFLFALLFVNHAMCMLCQLGPHVLVMAVIYEICHTWLFEDAIHYYPVR